MLFFFSSNHRQSCAQPLHFPDGEAICTRLRLCALYILPCLTLTLYFCSRMLAEQSNKMNTASSPLWRVPGPAPHLIPHTLPTKRFQCTCGSPPRLRLVAPLAHSAPQRDARHAVTSTVDVVRSIAHRALHVTGSSGFPEPFADPNALKLAMCAMSNPAQLA